MAKREKKDEPQLDSNAWMTTYTDLVTLLLTFFVLLLSMSIIDKQRKKIAINSLVGAFGFKPGGLSILGKPKGVNITKGSAPMTPEDVRFEQLRNIALKTGLEDEVTIVQENDYVILRMKNMIFFKQNSTEMEPESFQFLTEVAKFVKTENRPIELRGYSGKSENVFEDDPYKSAMFLSTKRAFAVFKFLNEKCDIPAKDMVAHGFGTSVEGINFKNIKSKPNRQVEIIIDYGSDLPYKVKNKDIEGGTLDFKGFLFRLPGEGNG